MRVQKQDSGSQTRHESNNMVKNAGKKRIEGKARVILREKQQEMELFNGKKRENKIQKASNWVL